MDGGRRRTTGLDYPCVHDERHALHRDPTAGQGATGRDGTLETKYIAVDSNTKVANAKCRRENATGAL